MKSTASLPRNGTDGASLASAYLHTLEPEQKRRLLALKLEQQRRWRYIARPEQLAPAGDWFIWWIDAGRGWGKTRTAAEWIKEQALSIPNSRWALVAATIADARDTMVEGESGLLALLKPHQLRGGTIDKAWNRSMGELYLSNGAKFKCYTSEKPRQLRGPQHHGAWCDELAAWEDAHIGAVDEKEITKGGGTTWSNLLFGLRLGKNPRIVIATTPKPVKLVFDLLELHEKKPGRITITKGTTYDNLNNLSEAFKMNVVELFEGTSMGRQELNAVLNREVRGALWQWAMLNPIRLPIPPPREQMARIVVAIDPAVTSDSTSDETGIVVVGLGLDGLGYVLEDATGIYTPLGWAEAAVRLYYKYHADRIVAEVNNGGDLVEVNVRTVDKRVPYKKVWASRGKVTRAEPVVALYEKALIRHAPRLTDLETEQTTWSAGSGQKSPGRIDAAVWGITDLLLTPATFSAQLS